MLRARNITFAYPPRLPGEHPTAVLKNCSFALERGTSLAIMGPSGAGKSTLAHVLAGLAPRHTGGTLSGAVEVNGVDVTHQPPEVGSIGLLFQDAVTQLFNTSVEDEVAWGLEALGVPADAIGHRVSEALARFELGHVRHRRPWALSGGQQKRLALAAIWAMQPQMLILDEPLGGLDPVGRAEVLTALDTLARAGTALLFMTLRPEVARQAKATSLITAGHMTAPFTSRELSPDDTRLVEAGVVYPVSQWPDLTLRTQPDDSNPALEAQSLTFHYPDEANVLHDIDLTIAAGQFVALIGRNGAGKSTLVRHFNGLLRPSRGTIRVRGRAIGDQPTGAIAREVGYLFQRPEQQLFAPTVREELTYGPQRLRMVDIPSRLETILARFDLGRVADSPPALLGYGTQRAVTLASLAMLAPPIVILDEPTVGLDGQGMAQLLDWLAELRARGTTILLVTHEVTMAARADRVIALDQGRIAADGDPDTVLSSEEHWVSML